MTASNWLAKLKELARIGEEDPGSAHDEFEHLTHGRFTRPPKGWASWSLEKRAKYLDDKFTMLEDLP